MKWHGTVGGQRHGGDFFHFFISNLVSRVAVGRIHAVTRRSAKAAAHASWRRFENLRDEGGSMRG